MVRPLLITGAALGVSLLTVFAGCSSSSSGGNGGTSSSSGGTSSSSGSSSGGGSTSSGSSGGDSGKKDASGSSSGSTSSSGGTGDDGTTASTCPYTATFTAGTYPASTLHSGACAAADITSFVNACGDAPATQNSCDTWQDNNVAGVTDGSAGTACGNCIFKPDNSGAAFVSVSDGGQGYFSMNFGGCIQLTDTTNGPACQAPYDALTDCNTFECGDCADSTTYGTCATAVNGAGGECNTQQTAFATACATDFGDGGPTTVASQCDPGAQTNPATQNPTFQLIISLICGSADGG